MSSCQVCSKSMGFIGLGAKKVIVLEGRSRITKYVCPQCHAAFVEQRRVAIEKDGFKPEDDPVCEMCSYSFYCANLTDAPPSMARWPDDHLVCSYPQRGVFRQYSSPSEFLLVEEGSPACDKYKQERGETKDGMISLGRVDLSTRPLEERQDSTPNDVDGRSLLRCNNCGARQRKGDWEKAMDARAHAMGSRGFENLSAPEECLNCGSTDLVDASSPERISEEPPKQVSELADQFAYAGREWEKAHSLGLREAQQGIMTHYDSTQATKKKMEKEIERLIAQARTKGILDDVLRLLQRKGEKGALYLIDAYL